MLIPYQDVVVFGDRMLAFISGMITLASVIGCAHRVFASDRKFNAAVHRVQKHKRPRFSLVYEVRPRAGFDYDDSQALRQLCGLAPVSRQSASVGAAGAGAGSASAAPIAHPSAPADELEPGAVADAEPGAGGVPC